MYSYALWAAKSWFSAKGAVCKAVLHSLTAPITYYIFDSARQLWRFTRLWTTIRPSPGANSILLTYRSGERKFHTVPNTAQGNLHLRVLNFTVCTCRAQGDQNECTYNMHAKVKVNTNFTQQAKLLDRTRIPPWSKRDAYNPHNLD